MFNLAHADQNGRGALNMKSAGICEMCGHHVAIRQKAHIVAEERKVENKVLLLCPPCHIMFDTHLKPKILKAVTSLPTLPESWKKSIYEQAAEASARARRRYQSTKSSGNPRRTGTVPFPAS